MRLCRWLPLACVGLWGCGATPAPGPSPACPSAVPEVAPTGDEAEPCASAAPNAASSSVPRVSVALPPEATATTIDDFAPFDLGAEGTRLRAYAALPGAVVAKDEFGAQSLECGELFAFVVDQPEVKGGPASGSLVVGGAGGKTKAVIAPRKGNAYRLIACVDLTGDGVPELVVGTWGAYSLILSLGAKVTTVYEGEPPFPERDPSGKVLLHVQDQRLGRLGLEIPGVLLPSIPSWWAYVGDRFRERTRDYPKRMDEQRAKALELAKQCLADHEIFCEERLAAFFAGTASVLDDGASVRARLPDEPLRKRFDELAVLVGKGGKK